MDETERIDLITRHTEEAFDKGCSRGRWFELMGAIAELISPGLNSADWYNRILHFLSAAYSKRDSSGFVIDILDKVNIHARFGCLIRYLETSNPTYPYLSILLESYVRGGGPDRLCMIERFANLPNFHAKEKALDALELYLDKEREDLKELRESQNVPLH